MSTDIKAGDYLCVPYRGKPRRMLVLQTFDSKVDARQYWTQHFLTSSTRTLERDQVKQGGCAILKYEGPGQLLLRSLQQLEYLVGAELVLNNWLYPGAAQG